LEKEIRTEEDEKQLSDLTEELDQLHREKAMGAQIRSGQDLAELMERPNAYFYGAEKKRSEAKMMKELNIDGERVCDQTRIREHVLKFYTNLYDSEPTNEEEFQEFLGYLSMKCPLELSFYEVSSIPDGTIVFPNFERGNLYCTTFYEKWEDTWFRWTTI